MRFPMLATKLVLLVFCQLPFLTSAAEETASANKSIALNSKKTSRQIRKNRKHNIIGGVSIVETWVPNKLILSYGYNRSADTTWELEYTRGTISFDFLFDDLAKIREQRISLLKRSFSNRNSFHFLYGLYYYDVKAFLGEDLLGTVPSGRYDVVNVNYYGLSWGFANRWQTSEKMNFSIDWFTIHIPLFDKKSDAPALYEVSDPSDRKDIEEILDYFDSFPTFALFRLQVGYSF